ILDWVPAHFPKDDYALRRFDGTALFEHADPRLGEHPDWGTLIFNYGRNEVRNYLLANALYWLDEFHADGLRVDAVASMLYLDYSRAPGQWLRNKFGGRENLEAIEFIRAVNHVVHTDYPGCAMIAEESTAWPGVTKPVGEGGLGFSFKWNMGWMHDTLEYFSIDPLFRSMHHDQSLDWHIAAEPARDGFGRFMERLGTFYRDTSALWRHDHDWTGFRWIDVADKQNSVMSYTRWDGNDHVVVVLNLTPVPRHRY